MAPPHPNGSGAFPPSTGWGVSGYRESGIGDGGAQDPAFWGDTKLVTKVVQAGGGQCHVCPPQHRGTPKSPSDPLGTGRGTPGEHQMDPPGPQSFIGGGGRDPPPASKKKHKFPG